jgi:uncharacterized membrane protein
LSKRKRKPSVIQKSKKARLTAEQRKEIREWIESICLILATLTSIGSLIYMIVNQ